jgi:hypothetical protein
MTRTLWPYLILPLAAAQPALAAGTADFITGTYSSKEGCDALAKHEEGKGDYLFLTAKGINGYQLSCEFVNVFPRAQQPGAVAVTFCDEPGFSHPELISLKPSGQDSIDVNLPDTPYSDEGVDAAAAQAPPTDNDTGTAGAADSGDAGAADDGGVPAPDDSTAGAAPPDQSTPDDNATAPSTAEGLANGGDNAQGSAGYVGLSGKYLRCQTPPG